MTHHSYKVKIEWTGNQGDGTLNYKSYNRNHTISAEGKYDTILASSDPSFLGDTSRYNPEELFLSSLSACHMLWYLHLCSVNKIIVMDYMDNATGIMEENKDGSGQFVEVTLNPIVTIENTDDINNVGLIAKANALHSEANKMCFIANSCNFTVGHNSKIIVKQTK